MKPTLLILAAGMGSRYGGLKQIDPVGPNGETIIDYSIYDALRADFGKLVFVIRHDIEAAFRETIGKKFEDKIAVEYAFQELDAIPKGFSVPPQRKKPWGTGHAILAAADVIREPFGVINADDFYGRNSFQILADCLKQTPTDTEKAHYCLVGFLLRNTLSEHGSVSRGVCESDAQSLLVSVEERVHIEKEGRGAKYRAADGTMVALTGDETVSMNMWGFTPSVFGYFQYLFVEFMKKHGTEEKSEFFLPTAVSEQIKSGKADVKVLISQDSWFGVTYPEDKAHVVQSVGGLIDSNEYPANLWSK